MSKKINYRGLNFTESEVCNLLELVRKQPESTTNLSLNEGDFFSCKSFDGDVYLVIRNHFNWGNKPSYRYCVSHTGVVFILDFTGDLYRRKSFEDKGYDG